MPLTTYAFLYCVIFRFSAALSPVSFYLPFSYLFFPSPICIFFVLIIFLKKYLFGKILLRFLALFSLFNSKFCFLITIFLISYKILKSFYLENSLALFLHAGISFFISTFILQKYFCFNVVTCSSNVLFNNLPFS